MHSTTSQVIRQKVRRLLTSPVVMWPALQGGLFAMWCNNGVWNNWDTFSMSLLSLGLGTAAYRLTLGGKKQTKLAREDLRRRGRRKEGSYYRRLRRELSRSREPRLDSYVNSLLSAYDRLQQVDRWRCEGGNQKQGGIELSEVHDQASRLYLECRNLLERSQELLKGAGQMATTEVRRRVMASREEVIGELQSSIQHLNHALDEVHSSQLSGASKPIAEATELRDELRRQVEVARRVEERMESMTGNWSSDSTWDGPVEAERVEPE